MIRALQKRPVLNFVSLLVLNIILLSLQVRKPSGQILLKSWTLNLLSPALSGASYVLGHGFHLWDNYVNLVGTHRQNVRLQQENYRLRLELQRLQELDRFHAQTEDYQKFQSQFDYTTRTGRVIARSAPFWRYALFLNIGSSDGVRVNNAVITPGGVVGRVLNVTANTSEVELITNNNAGVGVQVGDGRVQGVAQGSGSDTIRINYISNQSQVRLGDLVLTSGTDRIYPPGLPVGRVTVSHNSSQIFKEILMKPAVDLSNLQEILVLTGHQPAVGRRQ
ncbi:MAG TPA: rod shape-determining protein MreC [Acidobacteriota bacterium]|jgi:rod shape-determining protein MreC|nr:rod shape-determining protein MreC [Acidobacteriota bacterium]